MPAPASTPERFALLERSRVIVGDYHFVADRIEALYSTGDAYRERVEAHLHRLHRGLGNDDERFADAVEAFVEMTLDVMRMQDRYYRTGQFDAGPDVTDAGGLYVDDDLMGRRYLLGLYLAEVFWPNHLEKLEYFEHEVVARATRGLRVLEIGAGPGTYGLAVGRAVDCSALLLNDISPLSIDLIERIAAVDPVRRPDTLSCSTEDFLALDTAALGAFDLVLFSEIVEHLQDPALGMAKLDSLLADGARVFFATATNAAFYDHTIIFHSVDEIESLLHEHRFTVSSHREVPAMSGPDGRDVVDYVAVLRRASS